MVESRRSLRAAARDHRSPDTRPAIVDYLRKGHAVNATRLGPKLCAGMRPQGRGPMDVNLRRPIGSCPDATRIAQVPSSKTLAGLHCAALVDSNGLHRESSPWPSSKKLPFDPA